MHLISKNKYEKLEKLSTEKGIISALAIDQRGSIRKMIESQGAVEDIQSAVEQFKIAISEVLTTFASSILLDPEYGLPATKVRDENSGLLLAYEETGYDATEPGRMPDLLGDWSAKRIKETGADAVKFLLYYDVDESEEINNKKHAFVERIGSECMAEEIPFFLEILTYDHRMDDVKSAEYALVKPRKVIGAMKEFSKARYHADVLKVEVPVNMEFVAGFGTKEVLMNQDEARDYFKQQDESTHLPYIFLSAGVSSQLFQDTLDFAKEAGSQFNGVLCGRATWKDSVGIYVNDGDKAAREWLSTQGKENIDGLNTVLDRTATSWKEKVQVNH